MIRKLAPRNLVEAPGIPPHDTGDRESLTSSNRRRMVLRRKFAALQDFIPADDGYGSEATEAGRGRTSTHISGSVPKAEVNSQHRCASLSARTGLMRRNEQCGPI